MSTNTNPENLAKIGLVDSEIALFQPIVKKKKTKNKVSVAEHKPCRCGAAFSPWRANN